MGKPNWSIQAIADLSESQIEQELLKRSGIDASDIRANRMSLHVEFDDYTTICLKEYSYEYEYSMDTPSPEVAGYPGCCAVDILFGFPERKLNRIAALELAFIFKAAMKEEATIFNITLLKKAQSNVIALAEACGWYVIHEFRSRRSKRDLVTLST